MESVEYLYYAALVVFSYLLGAVPFGLVVGKVTRNIDIRQFGSGNIGATNALRTLGWKASASVLVLDLVKAIVPVLTTRFLFGLPELEALCGFAAIAGHNWSLYIRFRGGRGVSSGLGIMLLFSPVVTAVGFGLGLALIAWSRYVSLGSVAGAILVPILMLVVLVVGGPTGVPLPYVVFSWVVGAIVVFQHRDNIERLLAGNERRIGQDSIYRAVSSGTEKALGMGSDRRLVK